MDAVALTGVGLDAAGLVRIAVGAPVALESEALDRVAAKPGRRSETAIDRGDTIYGVTTGLGALVRERVSASTKPSRLSATCSAATRPASERRCRRRSCAPRSPSG